MALDRISLENFRNHRGTRLEGTARFNLLLGPNGAGKTNLLEALSLFAPGRGMRRAQLGDMVNDGAAESGFAIGADLVSGRTPVRLGTALRPDAPGRRMVRASGAALPAVRLAEWLSVSWLTPAMDRLFTDSAGGRRRFLDRMALTLSCGHAAQAGRYDRALRERNRLLSGTGAPEPRWLDALEREMAEAGAALAQGRRDTVATLSERIARLPEGPFGRPRLAISSAATEAASADPDRLIGLWRAGRAADRAAGRTLAGPHRDDLAVRMAGSGRAAAECSTGEQKALLIAIVLAHAELAAGSRPLLLLLDEVAAHLDPLRREALFARLADCGAQIWITGTESGPFAALDGAARWRVADGSANREA